MKKMIVGLGLFLCGFILLYSSKITTMIIEANTNATVVQQGIEGKLSFICIVLGIILLLYGYIKD
ncbi:MAG: hypothetical protein HFF42_10425 [Lawsonibacter sp.]|jgi:hypothetical protein|nr:hypothetical protein [Lawsonibacter sp.]